MPYSQKTALIFRFCTGESGYAASLFRCCSGSFGAALGGPKRSCERLYFFFCGGFPEFRSADCYLLDDFFRLCPGSRTFYRVKDSFPPRQRNDRRIMLRSSGAVCICSGRIEESTGKGAKISRRPSRRASVLSFENFYSPRIPSFTGREVDRFPLPVKFSDS